MSDEQPRSSGGGAAFVLLIAFGFVVMFWWIFAIITAVLMLAGLAWYACCRLDARDAARAAIADRADRQHAQILAGDQRGMYGRSERCQVLLPGLPQTDLCATREGRVVHREHPVVGGAGRHVKRHHGLNAVSRVDVDDH
jgi:hypothetical protein